LHRYESDFDAKTREIDVKAMRVPLDILSFHGYGKAYLRLLPVLRQTSLKHYFFCRPSQLPENYFLNKPTPMKTSLPPSSARPSRLRISAGSNLLATCFLLFALLLPDLSARTWTNNDGTKTFEGELVSYDADTGVVIVTLADGSTKTFPQTLLSADDITFLKSQSKQAAVADIAEKSDAAAPDSATEPKTPVAVEIPPHDGKEADMSKPVQVFILLGQSNMVGLGKIAGGEGSLENAVKTKKLYPYLADDAGNWIERKDVRFVRYMSGKGPLNNEWMTVTGRTIGPEFGIAHPVGNAIDAPVMILKACIGNRSLGWDLLPPGSERYELNGKVYAGYKDSPDSWDVGTEPKPIAWYAGKQYDDDTADAKRALADLATHYPGATKFEVAGFFFWQGEKDGGNAAHAAKYEENLVRFIKQLRKDFDSPNAKFVLATLGESTKGSTGNGGLILDAQLAVDGSTGKYPEFKGNVATVYSNPLSLGGSGNSHYNGNAETYMNVGEAMGHAMVELLKSAP
jgi:hypothetical protein